MDYLLLPGTPLVPGSTAVNKRDRFLAFWSFYLTVGDSAFICEVTLGTFNKCVLGHASQETGKCVWL